MLKIGFKKVSQIYKYIVVGQTFVFKKLPLLSIFWLPLIANTHFAMKKLLLYLLCCITGITYAQDQLFKKDNTKLEVKVLEINPTEIKYKLFTYQDGPTIIISKKDVALIIYQNGVHEVITTDPAAEKPTVIYYSPTQRPALPTLNDSALFRQLTSTKHLVSLNILDPLNGSFGVSYCTEFAKNYFNLYVPVSVGFTNPYFTQSTNSLVNNNYNYSYSSNGYTVSDFKFSCKTIDAGLGLHFQTSGKHPVTHFIGPYIGMAQFTGTFRESFYTYDQYTGYSNYSFADRSFVMNRVYVMLDNGVLFRATKNFNIMLLAGVGYHVDTYISNHAPNSAINYSPYQFPVNAFKFGLSFGYRF